MREGRPWQKKQPRGARTWADANLSKWASQGPNRKDVLPLPVFATLSQPRRRTPRDRMCSRSSAALLGTGEAEVRRLPLSAPEPLHKQL